MPKIKKGKSICITSMKGGVGKTITTLNLAGAYNLLNKKCIILDLDLGGGGIALSLNIEPKKNLYNVCYDMMNNSFKNISEYITRYNENIDIIVSSPLQRAYNTALCINKYHNVPLITDDNIIEISMGDWDGKYVSDMKEKYPEQMNDWWNNPHKFSAPNGESMLDVYSRVGSALQKIINNYREKTICIVSHGCAIRCMMCNIYNKPVTEINSIGWGDNTSVNIVECDGLYKNIKILVENDSKHLSSNFKCDTWVTK